jgi:hypothetical protein
LWIPAASGRQRFNVLGAYDAISREMISITNTESVNTETMCDLVQLIERTNRRRKRIPITLVLDNARYQRNSWVMQVAEEILSNLVFWDFGQAAACWIPSTNFLPSRSSVIC